MMLVFVLLIEYRDRGLVFGWPNQWSDDAVAKKLRLTPEPIEYVRKYHGYAFSWAVIFTFWYHPMENTYGHALGFSHTFLVMIQVIFVAKNKFDNLDILGELDLPKNSPEQILPISP
jgi:hypothetical protein